MNYIHPDDYLEQAKALPRGQDRRIGHWCGEGDVLKIAHTARGYTAYCFRCATTGFTPLEVKRLSDFDFLRQEEAVNELKQTMRLPNDFTREIPTRDALWLFKAGISVDRARSLGFGYSPSLARVILPVYDNGELVYLQARATMFPEQQPKYLNIKGADKDDILALYTPNDPHEFGNSLVITEDILSAARVGEVCPSASIMGTKLSDGQALKISAYDCAIWWLDGDDAGINGSRKGAAKLQFLLERQRIIRTPKDPKLYSKRHILRTLRGTEFDLGLV